MSAIRITVFLVAVIGAAVAQAAERPAAAQVSVHAEHRGGEIVHHYELRNRGSAPLDRFLLGCDCRPSGNGVTGAQLGVLPTATSAAGEDHLGQVLDVPAGALGAPPGWRATVRAPIGESRYWIEWRTFDSGAAIAGNQTLKGFSVALPVADPAFLSGGYLVAGPAMEQGGSGRVMPMDSRPPQLSVQLHIRDAVDPGGTFAVMTEVSASDDFDPEPRVYLESFVREEPGAGEPGTGRLALTYRATDASGNTSRETARIALPGTLAGMVGLPGTVILP